MGGKIDGVVLLFKIDVMYRMVPVLHKLHDNVFMDPLTLTIFFRDGTSFNRLKN